MEMQTKTYRVECKSTDDDGVIDAFIPMSTHSIDRDEEVIQPNAFAKSLVKFMKRPVLLSSHTYNDLRKQIGQFMDMKISEKGLYAKPNYYINQGNEEADWAYNLATKNMAAFSVGFIPKKWEDGDGIKSPRRTYTDVELLEVSHVVVPSNRDAIQGIRSKSVDPIINEVLDEVDKSLIIADAEDKQTPHGSHVCYCPECGEKVTVEESEKCKEQTCPKCGARMRAEETGERRDSSATNQITLIDGNDISSASASNYTISTNATGDTWSWVYTPETASVVNINTVPSQEEIKDDIDYLITVFEKDGVVELDTIEYSWKLVNAIMKLAGDDIPEEIRRKLQPIDIAKAIRDAFAQITGG